VEEQLASGCCGIKVLLIKIQINAHGFEVLDGSQQIDQRATRPIDGPCRRISNFLRPASLSMASRPGR
jgi:hypothetical protein